eukprot:gene5788-7986_t
MAEFTKSSIQDTSPIMQGNEADKAADYANYFCSYSYLYHQKQMLMDHVRMRAYHSAIMNNRHLFQGKVVLDVGTGSGVLAIWAAKAGAAKVFAVEYTDMANHARQLVNQNGLSGVVEVIQSSVEDLQLPCPVDIIVSEWMGYILLRESMLDSVIRARDKWLKPGGCMFPSHATMYWGAVSFEEDRLGKSNEFMSSMSEWDKFSNEMQRFYDIDMSALSDSYIKEQQDYYVYSSLWTELKIEHVIGQSVVIKKLDLTTCTLADAECVHKTPFEILTPFPIRISGFAGWFTVNFNGSTENPVSQRVTLSTGPEAGYTHWGQQVFYLKDAVDCSSDTRLHGTVEMLRQEKNKRLYSMNIDLLVDGEAVSKGSYEIP